MLASINWYDPKSLAGLSVDNSSKFALSDQLQPSHPDMINCGNPKIKFERKRDGLTLDIEYKGPNQIILACPLFHGP